MNSTLTRRDFLKSFVPDWCTRQNLKIAGIVAAAICALSLAVSFFQQLGVSGTLKLLGFALGVALVLWLLAELAAFGRKLLQKIRPTISTPIAAFLTVVGIWIVLVTWGAAGAYMYYRWQRGADMTGPVIGLGVSFLQQFFSLWSAWANPSSEKK